MERLNADTQPRTAAASLGAGEDIGDEMGEEGRNGIIREAETMIWYAIERRIEGETGNGDFMKTNNEDIIEANEVNNF